jgi:hypothetical protein
LNTDSKAIVPSGDVFKTISVCFAAEESIKENKRIAVKYI